MSIYYPMIIIVVIATLIGAFDFFTSRADKKLKQTIITAR